MKQLNKELVKRLPFLIILGLLLCILIYTRFVNLTWGLPYPFHPDERNIAWSITTLKTDDFFNPHFFAYGQLTIYLSYIMGFVYQLFTDGKPVDTFLLAIKSLRIIAAVSSVGTALFILLIIRLLLPVVGSKEEHLTKRLRSFGLVGVFYLAVFSPVFVQFSHFGTTESLLMFFYIFLIFISILCLQGKIKIRNYYIAAALICGLSVATKISSVIYLFLPFYVLWNTSKTEQDKKSRFLFFFFSSVRLIAITALISFVFSPYNLLDFNSFIGSMRYESEVATGRVEVFYTRSFTYSIPVLFQFLHIFPYTLGLPILLLFLGSFVILPWRDNKVHLLRFAFMAAFLPNAFMYAKWSRFMAPVYPVMVTMAALFMLMLYGKGLKFILARAKSNHLSLASWHIFFSIFFFIAALPGIAYLSIYTEPDVRFVASRWIYDTLPEHSYSLSETANVVDIPMPEPGYTGPLPAYEVISFDSYGLDASDMLPAQLESHIQNANYIFIPSRRVFMNHTCESVPPFAQASAGKQSFEIFSEKIESRFLQKKCAELVKKYPLLNNYYHELFSGRLGFVPVAEFTSYPRVTLFGKTIEFPDEQAEETWTVFDHPVIRIYKKTTEIK